MYHASDVGPELLRVMRRGVWEVRECPVAAALSSARRQYLAATLEPETGRPEGADTGAAPAYRPMPDRCMLFARKFAPDALPALLRLGALCDEEGTAIHPSCHDEAGKGEEVKTAVY